MPNEYEGSYCKRDELLFVKYIANKSSGFFGIRSLSCALGMTYRLTKFKPVMPNEYEGSYCKRDELLFVKIHSEHILWFLWDKVPQLSFRDDIAFNEIQTCHAE